MSDKIVFEGVVLALLLARTVPVKYNNFLPGFLQAPQTGFCDAMKSAKCSLAESELHVQSIPACCSYILLKVLIYHLKLHGFNLLCIPEAWLFQVKN